MKNIELYDNFKLSNTIKESIIPRPRTVDMNEVRQSNGYKMMLELGFKEYEEEAGVDLDAQGMKKHFRDRLGLLIFSNPKFSRNLQIGGTGIKAVIDRNKSREINLPGMPDVKTTNGMIEALNMVSSALAISDYLNKALR